MLAANEPHQHFISPHREAEGKSIIPSLLVHVNEEDKMRASYIKGIVSMLRKANLSQLRIIWTFASHYLKEE